MSAGTISTTASNLRQTRHVDCRGGVDIDVLAKLPDGNTFDVEVTLHPAGAGVTFTLWFPDGAVLAKLQEYPKRYRQDIVKAINFCARKCRRESLG